MTSEVSLQSKTAHAIAWNTVGRVIRILLQFLYIIILARWLRPEEFGIASMALIPFQVSTTLSTRTFTQSLVQRHNYDDITASTAFWLNVFFSILVFFIIVIFGLLSPNGADPRDFLILMLSIGLCSPISACSIVSLAELSRMMRFREIAQVESASSVIGFVAGLIALFAIPPVYSIGIFAVAQRLAETIGFFFIARWVPKLRFNWSASREIVRFSWPLYGTTILTNVIQSVDQFFVAYAIGGAQLGFYNFARRIIDQPVRLIMQAFERALFPAAVQTKDDQKNYNLLFSNSIRFITLTSSIVFLSLAVLLYSFVDLVMGAEWKGARIFILIFSIQACFIPIGSVLYAFIIASGATLEQFKFTVSRMLMVTIISLVFSAIFSWSATELAIAITIINIVLLYPNMVLAARVAKIDLRTGVIGAIVACMPAFGGLIAAGILYSALPSGLNIFMVVALQILFFALVASVLSIFLLRRQVVSILKFLKLKKSIRRV